MISLAGRYLPCANAEVADWLERHCDPAEILEFDQGYNHNLQHLPVLYEKLPPVKVGTFTYPRSASEFSVGYFLVDDADIAALRDTLWTTTGPQPVTLVINDLDAEGDDSTNRQVSTTVYALPPRPLSQISGANGFSLLCVVDERYFWWFRGDDIVVDVGVTTYEDLIDAIGTALGISITVDTISGDYGFPSNRFTSRRQPLPLLLDCVCNACGLKFVRKLDGTYRAENYTTATDTNTDEAGKVDASSGPYYPLAGGTFDSDILITNVPDTVQFVFGRTDDGVYSLTPYTVDVTLASLALAEFPNITGFDGKKVLTGDLTATFVSASLTNATELDDYANQYATDWYKWQIGETDQVLSGIAPWEPNGQVGQIIWTYTKDQCMTRVMRDRWVDRDLGRYRISGEEGPYSGLPDCDCESSGALVYNDADQAVAASTQVILAFNSERFDSSGFHDNTTNNSRLTVPTGMAGRYLIGCNIKWASAIVATYTAEILLNGTDIIAQSAVTNQTNNICTLYDLAEGDYVQVRVSHDDGSSINVSALSNYSPNFWLILECGIDGSDLIPDTTVPVVSNLCIPPRASEKLAATYNVLTGGSAGSWQDVGLSIVVAAGAWNIFGDVSSELQNSVCPSGSWSYMVYRLYDDTTGAAVGDSERMGLQSGVATDRKRHNATFTWPVVASVQTTYKLQAKLDTFAGGGAVTVGVADCKSNSDGWTHLFAEPSVTSLTLERLLIELPASWVLSDAVCQRIANDCCDSGGGGTTTTSCCSGAPIARTMYLIVWGMAAPYDYVNGIYTIICPALGSDWSYSSDAMSSAVTSAILSCTSNHWNLTVLAWNMGIDPPDILAAYADDGLVNGDLIPDCGPPVSFSGTATFAAGSGIGGQTFSFAIVS